MISKDLNDLMNSPSSGVIRKMFEEGNLLKKKFGEDNVYDFSLGNPDLDPPEGLLKACEEVSKDRSHMCHGYMPNAGYESTRKAMALKTSKEQGVEVSFKNIVMSVGAAAALNCVMKSLLNPGDEVLVLCPFFGEYTHYIRNHGGKLVPVKTNEDFSLNFDNVKASLSEKTACIIVNSPNNPTGRIYSEEEIDGLCKVLKAHGEACGRLPYIICDEPYRAISYGKEVVSLFPKYENTIIVTSFAKNLSVPGERIGYIAVNPSCKEADSVVAACIFVTRILGYVNAPAFFQKVIEKSWDCPCDYSLYEKRRNEIMEVMDYAGLKYASPDGAFYLFVKAPDSYNGDDFAFVEHLKKFNILCVPGSGFYGPGWIRLAYCCSEKTILNSKEAFKKALESK